MVNLWGYEGGVEKKNEAYQPQPPVYAETPYKKTSNKLFQTEKKSMVSQNDFFQCYNWVRDLLGILNLSRSWQWLDQ